MKLSLKYLGRDINNRPVYVDTNSKTNVLYVDVNARKGQDATLFTTFNNMFDGGPEKLVSSDTEIEFTPAREHLLG